MTDTLTETDVQDHFDQDGREPGVYAIRLEDPPNEPVEVANDWLETPGNRVVPKNGFVDRLAAAERLVYVGSHGESVYKRICEHAEGKQSSTIMDVYPPVGIVAWWPVDKDPKYLERTYAYDVADERVRVWMDGELL